MRHWPAITTAPAASADMRGAVVLFDVLGLIIGAILVGILMMLIAAGLTAVFGANPVGKFLGSAGVLTASSPLISWAGLIFGILAALGALRFGYAGCLVALLAGGVIGVLVFLVMSGELVSSLTVGFPLGAGLAALFWISAQPRPQAFETHPTPPERS